jgi:hypothetical protein
VLRMLRPVFVLLVKSFSLLHPSYVCHYHSESSICAGTASYRGIGALQ